MKIYVGNLPPATTQEQLSALFEDHGTPDSVMVVLDRVTGQGRGFGIVSMPDDQAAVAIAALDGAAFENRTLRVLEHVDRTDAQGRSPHGAGGGDHLVGRTATS